MAKKKITNLEEVNREINMMDGVHVSQIHEGNIMVYFFDDSLSFDELNEFQRRVKQVVVSHNCKVENIEICGIDNRTVAVIELDKVDRKYLISEILRIADDKFEDNEWFELATKEEKDLVTQLYNLYQYRNG